MHVGHWRALVAVGSTSTRAPVTGQFLVHFSGKSSSDIVYPVGHVQPFVVLDITPIASIFRNCREYHIFIVVSATFDAYTGVFRFRRPHVPMVTIFTLRRVVRL